MTDAEIIKAVAEKVMGWEAAGWNGQRFTRWVPPHPPSFNMDDWNPITDANHRDMVVERMRELGWKYCIQGHCNEHSATFYKEIPLQDSGYGYKLEPYIGYGSPGHAVCLAALKALEGA